MNYSFHGNIRQLLGGWNLLWTGEKVRKETFQKQNVEIAPDLTI